MDEQATLDVKAEIIKLSGKIDGLGLKIDAQRELLMAKIEAGDRDSINSILLTNDRVTTMGTRVTENSQRMKEAETRLDKTEKALETLAIVKSLAFGLAGVILIAVITALVALVIKSGP